ncbi:MAG: divergent polysaccharide deacetylase family protein [Bauldia sp.]
MAGSELTRPLGLSKPKPRRRGIYIAAGAAVAVLAVAGLAWLVVGARGPTATAVINAPPPKTVAALADQTGSMPPQKSGTGTLTDVTPSGALTNVGEVVIHNPSDPQPVVLAALPEQDLVEASSDGPLPRIAAGGRRPLDAYARPSQADPQNMRIAIVVGGLGIDPASTKGAIASLPGEVTLAFAPYDTTMAADVAAARAAGHELLLQIPLEPFGYPKTDPGPNTLTDDATPAENQGRLRWFLGRMTNYVGVVNYLGAVFTANEDAMTPVMQEIAGRGLLYLDDGSSGRSKAGAVAGSNAPFLRADVILDADLSPAAIDERLGQLQAIARQRGYAIATATAFPVTVDRVAAFVKAAADKGITIVPVSAMVAAHS